MVEESVVFCMTLLPLPDKVREPPSFTKMPPPIPVLAVDFAVLLCIIESVISAVHPLSIKIPPPLASARLYPTPPEKLESGSFAAADLYPIQTVPTV